MKERHSRRTCFQKVDAGTASAWLASVVDDTFERHRPQVEAVID